MDTKFNQTSFQDSLLSFSLDIYNQTDAVGSVCVSPYSIISALLMLMVGTRGSSRAQIKSAIFDDDMDDDVLYEQYKALNRRVFNTSELELYSATKSFVMDGYTLSNDVKKVAKNVFNADIGHKDFSKSKAAAYHMNNYIAKRTNDKIKDLISPSWLNSQTVMVLVNALYFKGSWGLPFDPKNTKKGYFLLTDGRDIVVDMMTMTRTIRYKEEEDYAVIALPYEVTDFEMVIILPTKRDGLPELKKTFSKDMIKEFASQRVRYERVIITLPKFAFKAESDLKNMLPKLGISDIFSHKADLSNLILAQRSNGIFVSEARHMVAIDVNEEGTEAAAATVIISLWRTIPMERIFIADHPFLFYITHRPTNSVVFIGDYNPS